jgi:hypothetical protein
MHDPARGYLISGSNHLWTRQLLDGTQDLRLGFGQMAVG